MDEEEFVTILEQPDGSMLDMPVQVACNGSKSASAPDRDAKFKKQRRAPPKYVWPNPWKIVHRCRTCIRARFDEEEISFDIYQRARDLMELSGHKMLPGSYHFCPNVARAGSTKERLASLDTEAEDQRCLQRSFDFGIFLSSSVSLQWLGWCARCAGRYFFPARTSWTT